MLQRRKREGQQGHRPTLEQEAAERIVGMLRDLRDALPVARWVELCLDVLVHIGGANGGVLVDAEGALLAGVGMSDPDRGRVRTWLLEQDDESRLTREGGLRAALHVVSEGRDIRLAVWWVDPATAMLDAEAIVLHASGVMALL